MRKPRDYDAELKALDDKARQLKARKVQQLGELVIACGADALPLDLLAGVLLAAADDNDLATREDWRKRGAAFFHRTRGDGGGNRCDARRVKPHDDSTKPASTEPSAA